MILFTETGVTTYSYNSLGLVSEKHQNGVLLQALDYDYAGRVSSVSGKEGVLKRFNYYPDGMIKTAWTPDALITFAYDESNAVVSKKVVMQTGEEWWLSANRTPDGLVEKLSVSPGVSIAYAYDDFRRIESVSVDGELIASNSLSATGLVKAVTYGNGLQESITHDQRGRPLSRTVRSPSTGDLLVQEAYYIDDENMIAGIHDLIGNVWMLGDTDYRGYLVGTSGIWGIREFNYDGVGNLSSIRNGDQLRELEYGPKNRFIKFAGEQSGVIYDDRGNMLAFGDHSLTYDSLDRLKSVSGVSNLTGEAYARTYGYDAFDNRIRADQTSSSLLLYRDLNNRPLTEIDGGRDEARTNVYLGQRHVAQISKDLTSGVKFRRYYHQDIFQSVDAVSNSAGQIISRKRFSPYGIEESTDGSGHSDYGFLGKRVERDAGISLLGARAYLPDIGRFLGPDAINVDVGGIGFFNRYAYGINNPLKYVDPTGFYAEKTMPDDRDDKGLGGDNDGDEKARNTESVFGSDEDDLEGAVQLASLPHAAIAIAVGAIKYGGLAVKAVKGVFKRFNGNTNKKEAGDNASSATSALRLEKQLTSQEQLGQLSKGGGTVISHPAKQADRIAAQTGRNPANIQKVSSDARVARDGQQIQTHSFRDSSTNELIEPKTIIGD